MALAMGQQCDCLMQDALHLSDSLPSIYRLIYVSPSTMVAKFFSLRD